MKKLTRMKLINWHRFQNCTIDFGKSNLLSGENGAGKSTLLDAIQFVITCSANSFNKAAHENGKRKLIGYIRCKTGKEDNPFERTGQISAHIALEFYEESKKRYFVVGAVVDSASEGQETTVRYLLDNTRFWDEMFFKQNNSPKSIAEFRKSNKKEIKQWCNSNAEAKRMIKARLGRIEDKFFSLIPKALAFKPIDDIKDFVYSYVLDEKEVNIESLRENVRSYQDLGKTLEIVKKKLAELEQISKHYNEVMNAEEKNNKYEYFLTHAKIDEMQENKKCWQQEIQNAMHSLKQQQQALESLKQQKEERQEMETALRVELRQNLDFVALEDRKKDLANLQKQEKAKQGEKAVLKKKVKLGLDSIYQLEQRCQEPFLQTYREMLENFEELSDIVPVQQMIETVIQYKHEQQSKAVEQIALCNMQKNELLSRQSELNQKINQLEKKKLSYPKAVDLLVSSIQLEFARLGRNAKPIVLCEVLELEDETWRNAVEGYLNTQRFYVLVEPKHFDIALGIYDKLRKEKKAYGVGLINAKNLEEYDVTAAGTLASVVSSQNIYAKRYINLILGKVTMCQRYEELKKYSVSITRECMKYQNHVASAIKPDIFETPYIGKNALRVQLQQAKQQWKEVQEKLDELNVSIEDWKALEQALKNDADMYIKYHIEVVRDLLFLQTEIEKCKNDIKELQKKSNILKKQIQLEVLEKQRQELENNIGDMREKIGRTRGEIDSKDKKIKDLEIKISAQRQLLEKIRQRFEQKWSFWQQEYEKRTSEKNYISFWENYNRTKLSNETFRKKAENLMIQLMMQYKSEHSFGAAASLGGYSEFAAVYDRLKNSELLEYEDKIRAARMAAEEEFREQFLAKLQENMKQAQMEFKELNQALKDISFSNEKYEFVYLASKKYRKYYDMIMDDFNVMQGESIFSGLFHENHKQVIDELFEKLALEEKAEKALDEFTDYRTYMDYDIKIIHNDRSYSLYSKVCEEKSGGETQTPFYVTVAASFVQLYSNSIGGESVGLVMFDEAFNNMDDERIDGVLEFLQRLPLQIIIAAPPDKIQYIAPAMEETLLVMTDGMVSYVEEYRRDRL